MKKVFFCLVSVVLVLFLCSCEQPDLNNNVQSNSLNDVIESLGSINQIYESSNTRFVTGETLLNYYEGTDVVFIGKLVEYNALTKSFADYVETITKQNNALMHQHYNIDFKKDKKYVEFCSYVDKKTGVVKEYEVRVFDGDFVYKKGEWYAKSCDFDSTFTKDISNHKTVDFGFKLGIVKLDPASLPTSKYTYDCKTGKVNELPSTEDPSDDDSSTPLPPLEYDSALAEEVLSKTAKIGTISKIFENGNVIFKSYEDKKGKTNYYYACMVEYSSVDDKISSLLDEAYERNGGFNAKNRFHHVGFGKDLNNESTYIEVIAIVNNKTGKISDYELRRIDKESYEKNPKEYYATSIHVKNL